MNSIRKTQWLLGLLLLGGTLAAQDANTINDQMLQAQNNLQQGKAKEAEVILQRIADASPKIGTAWYQLALAQKMQQKEALAAASALKAVDLMPGFLDAKILAADMLLKTNEQQAKDFLDDLVKQCEDVKAQKELLPVLVKADFAEAAGKLLDKLLALAPKDLQLLEQKAQLAINAKDLKLAAATYEDMLKIQERNPNVLQSLAQVYLSLGDKQKGMATYERTLKVNPSNILVRSRLIDMMVAAGAPPDEIAMQQKYLAYYKVVVERARQQAAAPKPPATPPPAGSSNK
jgi:tetratricopeptide (TPR) repeat protein